MLIHILIAYVTFLYCFYYSTPLLPPSFVQSDTCFFLLSILCTSSYYIIIFLHHFYHFCQAAIAIKISNLLIGFCSTDLLYFPIILVVYLQDDIIHKFVRNIMALPYLPVVLHGSIFATTCFWLYIYMLCLASVPWGIPLDIILYLLLKHLIMQILCHRLIIYLLFSTS